LARHLFLEWAAQQMPFGFASPPAQLPLETKQALGSLWLVP
jgi:hypothetical protein